MVDIVGAGVILCTREFCRASLGQQRVVVEVPDNFERIGKGFGEQRQGDLIEIDFEAVSDFDIGASFLRQVPRLIPNLTKFVT